MNTRQQQLFARGHFWPTLRAARLGTPKRHRVRSRKPDMIVFRRRCSRVF